METLISRSTELVQAMTFLLKTVQELSDLRFALIMVVIVVFIMVIFNRLTGRG